MPSTGFVGTLDQWESEVPNQSVRTLLKTIIDMTEKHQAKHVAVCTIFCIVWHVRTNVIATFLSIGLNGARGYLTLFIHFSILLKL